MNARVDFQLTPSLFEKKYEQIETQFDPELGIAWTYMNPIGAPCFNLGMLEELRAHDSAIEASRGCSLYQGEPHQIHYYVGGSKTEGVFSLGGNLNKLVSLVQSGDSDTLMRYAKLCIDAMYPRISNYHSPMITISLVQGEALGGGFETALCSSVIIAEKRARMGMPEILFNLFPGMGAYSLLGRRVGTRIAEEIILSGRVYTAEKLHEMGVVDVVVEDGMGQAAVYDYARQNQRHRNGLQAVFNCRQRFNPVSYDEMLNITRIWADAAMRLEEKDLRLMSRLGRSQLKRAVGDAKAAAEPVDAVQFATA
jgi:DSF synthase